MLNIQILTITDKLNTWKNMRQTRITRHIIITHTQGKMDLNTEMLNSQTHKTCTKINATRRKFTM